MDRRTTPLKWIDLQIDHNEMNPSNTLNMGQCFNWKRFDVHSRSYWIGVYSGLPLIIQQGQDTTLAACFDEHLIHERISVNRTIGSAKKQKVEKIDSSTFLKEQLRDYFQVSSELRPLYQLWNSGCERMKVVTSCLQGVRVLRQEPWECLISFICSSNNNISRITLMLDRIRKNYGHYIGSVFILPERGDDYFEFKMLSSEEISNELKASDQVAHLYSFPTPAELAKASESELRELGMGYRAKFLVETAKLVASKPVTFFEDLRSLAKRTTLPTITVTNDDIKQEETIPTETIKQEPVKGRKRKQLAVKEESKETEEEEGKIQGTISTSTTVLNEAQFIRNENRKLIQQTLLEFPGVGMKVADCIALFSLDCSESIPVDVHVWNIAMRDYASRYLSRSQYEKLKQKKSLTPTIYEEIGDIFRKLFQCHAGWAHSVLFAAELPNFRIRLPEQLQKEMKDFEDYQKKQKKLGKSS